MADTSKVHCIGDARGPPIAFHLTSGEAADRKAYDPLIDLPEPAPDALGSLQQVIDDLFCVSNGTAESAGADLQLSFRPRGSNSFLLIFRAMPNSHGCAAGARDN